MDGSVGLPNSTMDEEVEMPLEKGGGSKTRERNISELYDSYRKSGKIGTSKPESPEKARKQAVAIAYSEQRKKK